MKNWDFGDYIIFIILPLLILFAVVGGISEGAKNMHSWDQYCASRGFTHVYIGRGDFCKDAQGRLYVP